MIPMTIFGFLQVYYTVFKLGLPLWSLEIFAEACKSKRKYHEKLTNNNIGMTSVTGSGHFSSYKSQTVTSRSDKDLKLMHILQNELGYCSIKNFERNS